MIDVTLADGRGSDNKMKIYENGEIAVVVHPHPPKNEEIETSIPIREFFKTTAGSSDMVVNGSVTAVEFSVNADTLLDKYIKSIAVVIVDAGATLAEFGNLVALTNGVKFEWVTQDIGTTVINEGIKTNFEFFRQSGQEPIISSNVVGTAEGLLINIDFEKIFGLQYGIRLRSGTNDKIVFTVQDDMTGITQFDAIAYGIKI